MRRIKRTAAIVTVIWLTAAAWPADPGVRDLSLLVAPRFPCVWPVGMQQHVVVPNRTFGPGAFHRDLIVIDEHTGTQWDAPAHFVPPPDSGLAGAGPMGLVTGEKVRAWQFVGEACVIDVREHVDHAAPGASYLIGPEIVEAWEKAHRPLGFGDTVLFYGGYTDRYYRPLAEGGERFVHTVLRKETPAWPAPTPECMDLLAKRGVMSLGIDSPSMGPVPELAAATHQAGGKHGMIWTECATNLGSLPATGSAYVLLAAKHAGGSGSEARAIGVTEPTIARRLIDAAKAKRVADLSVVLDEELPITWPGRGPGEEAPRYLGKTLNAFSKARGPYFARTHTFDSQAGTHLVTPSFALPPEGFDRARYSAEIRTLVREFETKHGPLGHSSATADKAPLEALQGEVRVIDVSRLLGTTQSSDWPASPAITIDFLRDHEAKHGPIGSGDVVIFSSGYSDRHLKPLPATPALDRLFAAPLAGKAEGWPAPDVETIFELARRGVRCIGTDGPKLGGVQLRDGLFVSWAVAGRGLFEVEFLTGVSAMPPKGGYFIFAPIKIEGLRGAYGRALGFY